MHDPACPGMGCARERRDYANEQLCTKIIMLRMGTRASDPGIARVAGSVSHFRCKGESSEQGLPKRVGVSYSLCSLGTQCTHRVPWKPSR